MVLNRVLNDGQSQTGTTGGLGMALVHPVESFKHAGLVLRRDTDAGIADGQCPVFHGGLIHLGVKKHGTVGIDPGSGLYHTPCPWLWP